MFGRPKKALLLARRSFSIILLTVVIFSFSICKEQNKALARGIDATFPLGNQPLGVGWQNLEWKTANFARLVEAIEAAIRECRKDLFDENMDRLRRLSDTAERYVGSVFGLSPPSFKEYSGPAGKSPKWVDKIFEGLPPDWREQFKNEQKELEKSWKRLHDDISAKIQELEQAFRDNCQKESEDQVEEDVSDWTKIIKKPVKDGVTGKPLEGDTFVLPEDEDGTPTEVTDAYEPKDGDIIIIQAYCHKKEKYVVGRDPIPTDLALNPRPLRFVIKCGDEEAVENIRKSLARQGIVYSPECVEIKDFIRGKGIIELSYCTMEIDCYTKKGYFKPGDRHYKFYKCPDDWWSPGPEEEDPWEGPSEPEEDGWFEPEEERDGLFNDPYYSTTGSWGQCYDDQWGLKRIGFAADQSLLWPERGQPVVVAVLDTGVDMYHPELLGAIWTNKGEISDNGKDDDNNGYIDDVYGWNFVDNNNDITDLNGHGTLVSGIIGARTLNGIGIAGVNPWAKIMPVKITDFNNKGWSLSLARAIIYAVDNGARVINLSVGGKRLTYAEQLAVDHARDKGVLVVTAAGNDGINTNDFSPAGLDGVITVASTDPDDKRVNFSNWGREVDVAAPGVDILSLRARGTDYLFYEREDYKSRLAIIGEDNKYYRTGGSSFSAPFVSGAASLILSKNPKLSSQDLRRMIVYSAEDIDVPGRDQYTGYGLLDARAALAADPKYFIEVQIDGLKMAKRGERTVFDVSGTVDADRLKAAWIEVGRGEDPDTWKAVSSKIKKPVTQGLLGNFDVAEVKGYKKWTVRLIAEHKNGRKQEARYLLTLK